MSSTQLASTGWSASTQGNFADVIVVPNSGATTNLSVVEPITRQRRVIPSGIRHNLESFLYSEMLALAAIDECVFRRRHAAETVSAQIYCIDDLELALVEAPAIEAVWPTRQTLRFKSNSPLRRLPNRTPFIPISALLTE